ALPRGCLLDAEANEHVGGSRERGGAEFEQGVRPRGETRADLTRNREDLSPLLEREVGGDERTAPLACLDDDGRAAEAGDDPVAGRKPPRRRLDARRVLGDEQPRGGDAPRELGVRGGVVTVDA